MKLKELLCASVGMLQLFSHLRLRYSGIYMIVAVVLLVIGQRFRALGYLSLLVIALLWHFMYLLFGDKRRRIYVDEYVPNRVDRIGIFLLAAFYTGLLIIFCLGQLFAPEEMR